MKLIASKWPMSSTAKVGSASAIQNDRSHHRRLCSFSSLVTRSRQARLLASAIRFSSEVAVLRQLECSVNDFPMAAYCRANRSSPISVSFFSSACPAD